VTLPEIEESINYIERKGIIDGAEKVFQLKWTDLAEAIENYGLESLRTGERMILEDLLNYLRYKNLVRFSRFSFQTMSLEITPEHFYESMKFKGFTFLRSDLEVMMSGTLFYG